MNRLDRRDRFQEARERAEMGRPQAVPVRDLMSWFGASRRGYKVIDRIRAELRSAGLKTEPDFASAHIDSRVRLVLRAAPEVDIADEAEQYDVQLRVSSLASATQGLISVTPDDPIDVACSQMSLHDFSQLAVLSGRTLKGYISWETIGLSRISNDPRYVREALEAQPVVVVLDDPLLPLLPTVAQSNFVFVKGQNRELCGIITAADITEEFRSLAGPYLIMGEIERRLRRLIDAKCTQEELRGAKLNADDSRAVGSAEDLSLGELVRLFQSSEVWDRFGWRLDRRIFVKQLEEVRTVRNALMHFAEDPPTPEQRHLLDRFAKFLSGLQRA